ncbi:MAG: hypothetical protein HWE34_17615 [Methylocystaceae bacterium]|nr:hypothetical protein [Methylocystaceae bacterium]
MIGLNRHLFLIEDASSEKFVRKIKDGNFVFSWFDQRYELIAESHFERHEDKEFIVFSLDNEGARITEVQANVVSSEFFEDKERVYQSIDKIQLEDFSLGYRYQPTVIDQITDGIDRWKRAGKHHTLVSEGTIERNRQSKRRFGAYALFGAVILLIAMLFGTLLDSYYQSVLEQERLAKLRVKAITTTSERNRFLNSLSQLDLNGRYQNRFRGNRLIEVSGWVDSQFDFDRDRIAYNAHGDAAIDYDFRNVVVTELARSYINDLLGQLGVPSSDYDYVDKDLRIRVTRDDHDRVREKVLKDMSSSYPQIAVIFDVSALDYREIIDRIALVRFDGVPYIKTKSGEYLFEGTEIAKNTRIAKIFSTHFVIANETDVKNISYFRGD